MFQRIQKRCDASERINSIAKNESEKDLGAELPAPAPDLTVNCPIPCPSLLGRIDGGCSYGVKKVPFWGFM